MTKKDQLPNIQRSSSLHGRREIVAKVMEKLHCEEKPPLPRRPIRA